MKILCEKTRLLAGINTVSKAVSYKSTMDILQCILIEAYENRIRLTANDTELGIETIIEGQILEQGQIALEAKIFSEIIKGFMHRPRHRTIVLGYEGIEFQPWYLPFHGHKELTEMYQLSSDAFKSFPSGHCIQTGAAVISFYGLAALYPALRSKWGVVTVVFIALVLCVPISRLVLGAHYLSDVAVGIVLSALAGIYLLGREDLS